MKTRCLGWVALPSHPAPIIIADDGVDDAAITDGICYQCREVYLAQLKKEPAHEVDADRAV